MWLPDNNFNRWTKISTSNTVDPVSRKNYRPPSIVTSTAATPINESEPMEFYLDGFDENTKFYFYFHFTELQILKANQSRAFNITINGELWYEDVVPVYLNTTTIYSSLGTSGSQRYNFSIVKLENSTLPPIFNAFEVYSLVDVSQLETEQKDGMFIMSLIYLLVSLVYWLSAFLTIYV